MNTLEEKINCVLWYAELKSLQLTREKFATHYLKMGPSEHLIEGWMKQFRETGSVVEISKGESLTPKFDISSLVQELLQRSAEEHLIRFQLERIKLLASAANPPKTEFPVAPPESPETERSLDGETLTTASSSAPETSQAETPSYSPYKVTQPAPFLPLSSDKDPVDYPFKCDLCPSSFRHKRNLNTHHKIHSGEKPFECPVCQARFTAKLSMTQHLKIHTGEKPYKCEICEYRARAKSSLIKHARIHTGEKPYQCKLCGLCFRQKGALVNHGRIHTGERPYKCEVCGSCFRRKKTLILHSRLHEPPADEDVKPSVRIPEDSP